VALSGLRITGGEARGLGGVPWPSDIGGGVYVATAPVTISNCEIVDNSVYSSVSAGGGGLCLLHSDATLSGNTIRGNEAAGLHSSGGGAFLWQSPAVFDGNTVSDNRAQDGDGGGISMGESAAELRDNTIFSNTADHGGGIYLAFAGATMSGNTIISNTAARYGGGLLLYYSDATVAGNDVAANRADALYGGGAAIAYSEAVLSGNTFISNTSNGAGGGLYLWESSSRLINNVIAQNRAASEGSGLIIFGGAPQLSHNTVARNSGRDGSGIYVAGGYDSRGVVAMTNTVLVSQTVGITVTAYNTVALEATLWGTDTWANGTDWDGAGTILTGTVNVWGDPAFVDPDSGDYHIAPGSAAIDAGVDAGVSVDMDGEPRPAGGGFDIGADEVPALVRYVATDGADSGDCSTPAGRCLTVQYAVDQAWEGDEVRVATGVYTGVQGRPAPAGYSGPSIITQVVHISKSITVRGGYTTTDWTTSNPISYPTTLDAEWQGRVLVISGTITTTVEGLRITRGDAAGLGGVREYYNLGGGVCVMTATAVLSGSWILNNRADYGGGLGLMGSHAWVSANTFTSNTVGYAGGGLHAEGSEVVVNGNSFITNMAGFDGGGLFVYGTDTSLMGNIFVENRADLWGGGVGAHQCPEITLENNHVVSNTAVDGGGLMITVISATLRRNLISANHGELADGGLLIGGEQVTLDGNLIVGNTTGGEAGGLSLGSEKATLSNNVIADNTALVAGGGLLILDAGYADLPAHANLVHNTIARNQAGDGTGILVVDWWGGEGVTVTATDTVLVSHTVGISVSAGNTVTLRGTLWGSGAWANLVDWGGAGTIITGTVNVWGVPVFVDPDSGDYHIGPGSAAIDAGVDAGVLVDMDGEPRPVGMGYDIGADEYPAGLWLTKSAFPDPVQAGGPLTYTIQATNNGLVTVTVTLTDILPVHAAPTGLLTWTPLSLLPGDSWTATVLVTVETGYSGPLTNVVQATSVEGFSGAYTLTTPAYLPVAAEFTAVPTTGVAPLTVTFTNLSTGSYSSSLWDFGDGVTSTLDSPTHVYSAGVYTVTLSVSGPGGSDSETKVGYITVYEPPTAEFSADPTSGPAPLTVDFINLSSGDYDTCAWDFGDGIGFSNSCGDTSYEYTTAGVYTVTLSVGGPGGSDSETKAGYITVRYGSVIFLPVVMRDHPPVGEEAAGQYRFHLFDRGLTTRVGRAFPWRHGGSPAAANP
jgi:parallel beta-helix repeat protein